MSTGTMSRIHLMEGRTIEEKQEDGALVCRFIPELVNEYVYMNSTSLLTLMKRVSKNEITLTEQQVQGFMDKGCNLFIVDHAFTEAGKTSFYFIKEVDCVLEGAVVTSNLMH